MTWSQPGVEQTPLRTTVLVALIPLTAGIGVLFTRQPLFTLIGPAFLAPVLTRYFLKPSYRLTTDSARANWGTGQTEIRWENVRRMTQGEQTIHLSPILKDDLRQSFRGVELRLPEEPELREAIVARVRASVPDGLVYDGDHGEQNA